MNLLLHLFTPQVSNNHRARMLHPSFLYAIIGALIFFQVTLNALTLIVPSVLGYATNISVEDLVKYTNGERAARGLGLVTLDRQLENAAAGKAADMLAKQYWAHNSPDGKNPWNFIIGAGYNYLYAGENLARDFPDSKSVVDAWMASPAHRDNVLNPRYENVGFAVVNGKYGNYETTLVVQMFGTRVGSKPTVEAPQVVEKPVVIEPVKVSSSPGMILNVSAPPPVVNSVVKINVFSWTKNIIFGLSLFLVGLFFIDGIMIYKKKIIRVSGPSVAHLMFFLVLLLVVNLIGRGVVL